LAGVGGTTATWSHFARAQHQSTKVGLLATGVLPPGTVEAFRDGLRQRGYIEGKNLALDVRSLHGSLEKDSDVAADMVRGGVDVIVAWATPAALAAQRATSTIPIVMVSVGDPVGAGLIASLARPGGNITGFSNQDADSSTKQAELFVEMVPGIKRVGIVYNHTNQSSTAQLRAAQSAMSQLHVASEAAKALSTEEFEEALTRLRQTGVEGLVFISDASTIEHRKMIAEWATAHRLPTMFQRRQNVEAGGLMSYGANLLALFGQAASYVERILRGARPAELPVVQPDRFELVLNGRTAKALGLSIPPSILARADEVIE
jgi:putative tryptophan/tyrosine transport system substrate-binding protein